MGELMKLELAESNEITFSLNHLGIVAGTCNLLKIPERINERIGTTHKSRVIQPGTAVAAMIVNGLGFANTQLYLTSLFYRDKPTELFFGEGVKAEDLDDHALGKALDEIHAYGVTKLYSEVAFEIAIEHGLVGNNAHIDSTSFVMHGDDYSGIGENVIEIRKGYSKDNKPHLNQAMLNMVITGAANFPLWMEPKSGNTSDQVSFHETIKRVRDFQKQLCLPEFTWIADSSFYTKDRLLSTSSYLWISRVPSNITECNALLKASEDSFQWQCDKDGYKFTEQECSYGNIKQRYILIYSEQAFKREKETFEKNLKKEKTELEKKCFHLSNQVFTCREDAIVAAQELQKKYPLWKLKADTEIIEAYGSLGRPKKGSVKETKGYKITYEIEPSDEEVNKVLATKGRFVLATNNLNKEQLPAASLLKQYKEQQKVESGFKFLKDPWFMLDSFYLKKPERIESLMMIMCLCLMVYNFAQHTLRKALVDNNETVPNQLNKEIKNPTMRSIFQQMQGISIIQFRDSIGNILRNVIARLNQVHIKIIRLLGESVCNMYGIKTFYSS